MKCPKCGLENRSGVRFCRQCGQTLPVAPPATSSLAVAACPTCGAATKPQARFCKQCGQALPVAPFAPPHAAACPDCGAAVKLGARFCPKCGRRLTAKSAPPAAPPSLPPADVDVHIEGGVSGQVAIGNNIIQIGDVHGGVVNVAMPEEKPQIRPRPTPVSLIPRPFPGLLDREPEVDAATAALQSALRQDTAAPVEFYGHAGMGKTSLLRHLAHRSAADAFPDGVVYLSANQPSEDILQSIYDAFYKCDISFKPTEGQIRQSLQGRRALFILDDVELARDEVEALMNVAPTCTFLLGSPERRLWGEGRAMELDGLPPDDALTLVERELDRPLASAERAAARNLCAMLEGHPLRILQATATAREKGLSLTEAARQIQTPSPAATLTAQVLASLSEQGRILLAAMAALGDAPVHAQHLGEITGIPNVTPILQTLQQRGLAQAHSPRYNLTGDLAQTLQQTWDLDPWAERALAHFTTWAEGQQQAPDRLLEEADALLQVLEQAVQTKRWENVLRLGRAVEGALAVGKRWGAWAQVLRWILQAAQALGEQAAQSWALHQLGSRALCLGDTSAARTALTKALRLREALGDKAGAAITKHNLKLLLAPPTPPKKKPPKKPPQPPSTPAAATGVPALIKGAIALVAASLLALGGVGTWYFFLRPTPTPAPVEVTATPLPTLRPTPTSPPPTEAPPVEEPWVSIELVDGCGREYVRDDYTTLRVETNIESRVEIWLDDTIFEEVWLSPGEVWEIEWTFENLQSGSHALWAVLLT
ncbi:MAG: zinc ribbon domain-containing protein, partial [Chloroflexota bacterium]|nr:zinc ribbon domain-containing protein [Chloroflexota bacterium]